MKTTAKVFIVIGMIVNCFLVFPIIIGFYALSQIEEATSAKELTVPSILTLLFCNVLAGIFMFAIKDSDLDPHISNGQSQKNNYYNYPESTTSNNISAEKTENEVSNFVTNNDQLKDYIIDNVKLSNTLIAVDGEVIDVVDEARKFISSEVVRSSENTYRKICALYKGEKVYLSIAEIAMCAVNLESFKRSSDGSLYPRGFKILNEFICGPQFQQQTLMDIFMYCDCIDKIHTELENRLGITISPQGDIIE